MVLPDALDATDAASIHRGDCPRDMAEADMPDVLVDRLEFGYRGKEVVRLDRFQYGQWRYQRVRACPRDLRGIV
jgi:hypothetical protein